MKVQTLCKIKQKENKKKGFIFTLWLNAKMSVRPDIGLKKFLVFVSLSVSAWRDSGCRNYPICYKFGTNVYLLYKISYTVFGVHCHISTYTGIHNMAYGEKFFKISFDVIILHKIYIRYLVVQ